MADPTISAGLRRPALLKRGLLTDAVTLAHTGVVNGRGNSQRYRAPGSSQSSTGTVNEQAASDQRSPVVLNIRNWMYQAPEATSAAKRTRPARESGVVFGSEIMKKVNSSSAPPSSRCSGIVSGSPRYKDRPTSSAA